MTTRDGLKYLKTYAFIAKWSKHKIKSVRGQFLKLETDDQRAAFMRQALRDTVDVELLRKELT